MNTGSTPRMTERLIPTVDPDDLKAARNFPQEVEKLGTVRGATELSQLRKADLSGTDLVRWTTKSQTYLVDIHFRWMLLIQIVQLNKDRKLELPGMENGGPSEAKAVAKVSMRVTPYSIDYKSLPFDTEELMRLIEER